MNFGRKMSVTGDVKSSNPADNSLDTRDPQVNIDRFATLSYLFASDPGAGKLTLATVAHGLSFTPFAYALIRDASNDVTVMGQWRVFFSDGFGTLEQKIYTEVDGTNLKLYYERIQTGIAPVGVNMNGLTFNAKYYIWGNEIG